MYNNGVYVRTTSNNSGVCVVHSGYNRGIYANPSTIIVLRPVPLGIIMVIMVFVFIPSAIIVVFIFVPSAIIVVFVLYHR